MDGRVRAVLAMAGAPPACGPGGHPPVVAHTGPDDPAAEADAQLARMVADALGEDHGVECVAVRGGPVGALRKAAADAELLVLGSPRPVKLAKMSSTLVASRLIYRAPCPVVVMPPPLGADRALRRGAARLAAGVVQAAGTAGHPGLPPPIPPGR